MVQRQNCKEHIYKFFLKKEVNSCTTEKSLHSPLDLNLINVQTVSLTNCHFLSFKVLKITHAPVSISPHTFLLLKLNWMIKSPGWSTKKEVYANTAPLGQINQAEFIKAVCTFERVDHKLEISKYTHSRVNCFDCILCDLQDVSRKGSQQGKQ